MADSISEERIFNACRVLFGPDVRLTREFLHYLQPGGAKSEYRRRAKRLHPDLHGHDPALQRRQAELFRELVEAQELVLDFLELRDGGRWRPPPGSDAKRRAAKPDRPPETEQSAPGGEEWYFNGSVPKRYLEIGLFLFYRRLIPFKELIAALVWQRRQRPALGAIARRWGWLDEAAVRRIATDTAHFGRFGERAVEMGLLNAFQVRTLLHYQRSQQQRLGDYFVRRGLVGRVRMESLADELARHNADFLARERRWSRSA